MENYEAKNHDDMNEILEQHYRDNKISDPIGISIDNLVYKVMGQIHRVIPRDFERFRHPNMGGDYGLYGITISPEWLIKFGFEKTIDIVGTYKIEYIDYRINQFVLFCLPSGITEVEFWPVHNNIDERGYIAGLKYVHQLQNLYYLLTGKTLEIK